MAAPITDRRGPVAKSAFGTGILRTVRGSVRRVCALATICALGVAIFCGLAAACIDLRAGADAFFDAQHLFDLRVMSTLGLTEEDVDALAALEGVASAEGGHAETAYVSVGGVSERVDVNELLPSGTNAPYVLEGHLPTRADQVAVSARFLRDSGLWLGDTVTFSAASDQDDGASTAVFERREYTIIASVIDPMNVNAGEGSMAMRSAGSSQYSFFVLPECVTASAYTVVYLRVAGAEAPLSYSGAYTDLVLEAESQVESISAERAAARTAGVVASATAEVDSAEASAQAELDGAQAELDGAQARIDAGRAELAGSVGELASGRAQVEDGLAELAAGLGCTQDQIPATIAARREELAAAAAELARGRAQVEAAAQMLASIPYVSDVWPSAAWERLASTADPAEADAAAAEVSAAVDPLVRDSVATLEEVADYLVSEEFSQAVEQAGGVWDALPEPVRATVEERLASLPPALVSAVRGLLADPATAAGRVRETAALLARVGELAPGMAEIVRGEARVAAGTEQLDVAWASYQRLVDAQASLADGRAQAEGAAAELDDGQRQVDTGRDELAARRQDAAEQIQQARARANDITPATWHVQGRSSLGSYASVDSDASSIEAIGAVIPVVFLVVAVLVSLTTMTRMVDEERELIGLYKALGYGRARILSKYVAYALVACAAGGVVGALMGFVALPLILFSIFRAMYSLPSFPLLFSAAHALGSLGLFTLAIVGATAASCARSLREVPASLMRPRPPRAGRRILLERVAPVWRRMGFLSKVTARNLFRYKRRFLMTVLGIAGCCALLVCGFGIRDTVRSLPQRQYGQEGVVRYDVLALTAADDLDALADELAADGQVVGAERVFVDNVTLARNGVRESMQLMVVPDGLDLEGYLSVRDLSGTPLNLAERGMVVTVNAQQVLGFAVGDPVAAQDSTLTSADLVANSVVANYLGNTVFMAQAAYEDAFDRNLRPNAVLVRLSGTADQRLEFAEELARDPRVLSVTSTERLVRSFESSFALINTVVYVVIVLAAALAFTVVFTLSSTNISERERELATMKVLGFRRGEVRRYINRETVLLTLMGILLGLPAGYALTRSLTYILRMPALYFDARVAWLTYVIAAGLALVFTLLVNRMTNRTVDRIDMVGALKSAE